MKNYIARMKSRRHMRKIQNELKSVGSSLEITFPINLKGLQYINIGDDCYFGADCRIEAWDAYQKQRFTPSIVFGSRTRIAGNVHIGAINSITFGEDVLIGRNVFITDHAHGDSSAEQLCIAPNDRPLFSKGSVSIGNKVWICENAIILPNVHIGDGAIIAAGAVVTHDVPAGCVAAGNPARVVKHIA